MDSPSVSTIIQADGSKPFGKEELPQFLPAAQMEPESIDVASPSPLCIEGNVFQYSNFIERSIHVFGEHEYRRDRNDPGLVLIFNQEDFDESDKLKRDGSSKDVTELVTCLGRHGFNINDSDIIKNATRKHFLEVINDTSKSERLAEINCLMIIVLSHGQSNNRFSMKDKGGYCFVEEVVQPFVSLDVLKGIPKIFVFQTCKTEDRNSADVSTLYPNIQADLLQPDVVLVFSTLEGDVAFRNKTDGSWFIQEFCRNIYSYASREDFLSILMRINKSLVRNYYFVKAKKEHEHYNSKQVPLFISTLTKLFYLYKSKDTVWQLELLIQLRKNDLKLKRLLYKIDQNF